MRFSSDFSLVETNYSLPQIEIDVYCDLTPRQKAMYRTLRENISITDLVARASSLSDDDSVKRLMNLIMQFRKVCNHPELFERADVTAPFAFAALNKTASLIRDADFLEVPYATQSHIEYRIPKFLYREGGLVNVPGVESRAGFDSFYLDRLMNIWHPDYVQKSLNKGDSTFAFSRGLDYSPSELFQAVSGHGVVRLGKAMKRQRRVQAVKFYEECVPFPFPSTSIAADTSSLRSAQDDEPPFAPLQLSVPPKSSLLPFASTWRANGLIPFAEVEQNYRLSSPLTRPDARFYMDPAVAPTITTFCSDRSFAYEAEEARFDNLFSRAIFGIPPPSAESSAAITEYEEALPGFSPQGVLSASDASQLPLPPMQVPQLHKLILDSGKLAKLDQLLTELKADGHRVLVYFQMTRMIDLFEEYLAFRQHKYLRLDGSSSIAERRDMVTDWQTKFVFSLLLSHPFPLVLTLSSPPPQTRNLHLPPVDPRRWSRY